MSKKKKLLTGIGIVLLLFVGYLTFVFFNLGKEMRALTFTGISAENVADGTYQGIAETSIVNAEVAVTVKDHRITGIDIIRHDNGLGGKAEAIIDEMIAGNTYEVDAVSGATMSSQVIKSAVNDALEQGKE